MNIGIFGGAFNPIHFGHLILAQSAMEQYLLQKVLFVVSLNPPHKECMDVSFKHRCEMTAIAIKDTLAFEVSDIEKEIEGKTYTFYVLEKIIHKYGKDNNYFLMIGQDEANYFDKWFRYKDILDMCKVIVGGRETNLAPNNICFDTINMPNIDISSSNLRERIKQNKSILYYMPSDLAKYIQNKEFYT